MFTIRCVLTTSAARFAAGTMVVSLFTTVATLDCIAFCASCSGMLEVLKILFLKNLRKTLLSTVR